MDVTAFMNTDLYVYGLLPLLIFLARLVDVSLGTLRLVFIARGFKYLAPFIAFFEVSIWLLAIKQIMTEITNPVTFLAYALGFAAGTFLGLILEEKLSVGKELLRIVTKRKSTKLISVLKKAGYKPIVTDAVNNEGEVSIILLILNRQAVPKVKEIVKKYNPTAAYSIEDVRFVSEERGIPDIKEKRRLRLVKGFRNSK